MTRSTGPTSAEGKARSAQNARKHGLRAVNSVAPEEADALQALVRDLTREYGPGNAMLSLTIGRVAKDMTRLRSLDVTENAMFAAARIQVLDAKRAGEPQYKWVSDALLQAAAVPPLKVWHLLSRYRTERNRRISKGLGELMVLKERAQRRAGANRALPRGAMHTVKKELASVRGAQATGWNVRPSDYGALLGKWLTPDQAAAVLELLAELRADFRPRTATEHILVERLAMSVSMCRRMYVLEEAVLEVAGVHAKRMHERGHPRLAGLDLELAQAIAMPEVQLLDMVAQYGGALDREISRTMGELMHIQDATALAIAEARPPKRLAAARAL